MGRQQIHIYEKENKMNTYQTLQQKALGLAFILGPLLLTLGAAVYVLGIGLTPFGTDSWVDGWHISGLRFPDYDPHPV